MDNHLLTIREDRLLKSGLVDQYQSLETCVRDHIGIQAQYTNYSLISMLLRTQEHVDIDDIYQSPNLIRSWIQRDTVHFLHKDDFFAISSLRQSKHSWVYDYFERHEIQHRDVLDFIHKQVPEEGILSTRLSELLKAQFGKEANNWSSALILGNINHRIYGKASDKGILFYQFQDSDKGQMTHLDWQDLFENYLKTYGPATLNDFAHWMGIGMMQLQKVVDLNAEVVEKIELGKKSYYSFKNTQTKKVSPSKKIDYPIILSKFDPLMVSYKDKSWLLNDMNARTIWGSGGQIEAVILDEEGIMASWRMKTTPKTISITIQAFKPIQENDKAKLREKFELLSRRMHRDMVTIEFISAT
ncbi:winged helix DNA-binding domain-containing protein [Granulicatella seriolae]|uniref:Winged helix DNA-binding domain-containing protein n=1 Tax=Granulicatella seriolae TaxID=2967226 RepID=A0ABT1WPS9_9LACT|nr:winged helix DNA-binding domain-containing protein [Granulicatella seriolae]